MSHYIYLMIDIGAILVPLAFSFHPLLKFHKHWKFYFPSMVLVGVFLLIWDELFTQSGIWGFNPDYLIGVNVGSLPLEEILFFVCIPYACAFSYHCFSTFNLNRLSEKSSKIITIVICTISILASIVYMDRLYTFINFTLVFLSLASLQFLIKLPQLKVIYFTYFFLLVPFTIVNGILTGSLLDEPIVWYDNLENSGIRMATIPVEDMFYGLILIAWNIGLYELFKKRYSKIS